MLGKGLESLIPPQGKGSREDPGFYIPNRNLGKEDQRMTPIPQKEIQPNHQKHRKEHESVFHIEIEKIHANPYQPRKWFDDNELGELAESIREFGVIQPVIVSKLVRETEKGTDVEYQLIAGERRLLASKKLGFEKIPAIIRRVDSKQKELEMALIENIQRSNLSPLELARSFARLSDEFGLTQREIAGRAGKSRETIANTMRLLQLPPEIQESLEKGEINESQARTLLGISNVQYQREAFRKLLSDSMSVEKLRVETKPKTVDPELHHWKKRFEEFFGAATQITKRGGRGKIAIHFHSDDEWRGILGKLFPED